MLKEKRLHWIEAEWASVLEHAVPMIEKGLHRVAALLKAQRLALPKARHRDEGSLAKACTPSNGTFDRALASFKKRPPIAPKPAAPSVAATPHDTNDSIDGLVRWTTRERALMAAGVELQKRKPGCEHLSLHALYIMVQPLVLPADRQRAPGGIKVSSYQSKLQRQHSEGIADAWKFPDTQNPFKSQAVSAPAPDGIKAPGAPFEFAPAGAPVLQDPGMASAAAAFGSTMMQAFETLLVARDEYMAKDMARRLAESSTSLHERIGPMVQELLQVQVQHIAHEVEKGLRNVLLQELGGSSAAPAPAPAPVATAPATNGHVIEGKASGLRIDVLGTIDAEWRQRIKDATTEVDELRFVDFTKASEFAPHRGRHLVVMQQGKLPRALQKKIDTVGITPLFVRDAGGHVLRAVQDLKRGAGSAITLQ